jgi:hypothetical protein
MTKAKIYYAQVDDSWTKQEKLGHLEKLVQQCAVAGDYT